VAVLPIVTYPDPVLTKACPPAERIDDELRRLANDMVETMFAAETGIGLAAPQVGRLVSLVVVESDPVNRNGQALCLFNPRIVSAQGEETAEEGCLSLPDHYAPVTRAAQVVVQALDRDGKPLRVEAEGLLARCLQHEIDHLRGRLVLDYESPLKRALYRKRRLKELKRRRRAS